jgi:hypothetical protein
MELGNGERDMATISEADEQLGGCKKDFRDALRGVGI